MKNIYILLLLLGISTSSFSHTLWVKGTNEKDSKIDLIYGEDFPNPETIKKERESLFEPVKLVSEKEEIELIKGKEFYNYHTKESLKEGTYIIKAKYRPTAWIKKADGKWEMNKTRKDIQDEAKKCGIYSMFAKSYLVIGNSDSEFVTKPFGDEFEITPLVKLSEIKEGKSVKFRVTKNGKAVQSLEVYRSLAGYEDKPHSHDDHESTSMPFFAKTNKNGEFTFKALKDGFWYLSSIYKQDTNNKDCEFIEDETTISFEVK